MSDYIIVHNDKVRFRAQVGPAIVPGPPFVEWNIVGSGAGTFQKKKLCVVGDEASVVVPCSYNNGDFKGGSGNLKILALTDQVAAKTRSGNKPVLLMGSKFLSILIPTARALNSVGVPDPVPFYIGTGNFGHPSNIKKLKGT